MDDLVERLRTLEPDGFARHLPPDEGGRESAVLMLFGPGPGGDASTASTTNGNATGGDHVVLIERSHTMRRQPGQLAFPGGTRDSGDADLVVTALREAHEETGLDPAGVDVVATLPSHHLAPSAFVVAPVLGWWRQPSPLSVRDPAEVHAVISVPVAHLLDSGSRFSAVHPSGFIGPAFDLDGLFLWGFTALLLSRVFDLAELSAPWDEQRQRPVPERFRRRSS
jgi:8-oxo-dGTP pyrophosphatase MutT (NUDIX family)